MEAPLPAPSIGACPAQTAVPVLVTNIIENINTTFSKAKYKILTYIWCIETLSKNEENF